MVALNHQKNKLNFNKWKYKWDNTIFNTLHEINHNLELASSISQYKRLNQVFFKCVEQDIPKLHIRIFERKR